MALELIPLFPLQVVLFPQLPLPLHIFEPRYREMIGQCLARQQEFGVILAKEREIASVGCTAEIVDVVKKYPDGRLDIATVGRRRFQVVELVEERAYLQGKVEVLLDQEEPATTPIPAERLLPLYQEILSLLTGQSPSEPQFSQEQLSFQIAGVLPFDLSAKQTLLESRSEADRRQGLLEQMEQLARRLRRMKQVKAVASGNGHGGRIE